MVVHLQLHIRSLSMQNIFHKQRPVENIDVVVAAGEAKECMPNVQQLM